MEDTKLWLTEEFVTSILKASIEDDNKDTVGGGDVMIVQYTAKRALADGKNYTSVIYRVNVSYKHANTDEILNRNYIIKKLLDSTKEWFIGKEEETLKSIPIIEGYLNCRFAAKLYTHNDGVMVMEDLNDQGFEQSRVKLLDFDHCEVALKALAKFHAGSVLLRQQRPELVEKISRDLFFSLPDVDIMAHFQNGICRFGEEVSTWPESSQYAEHFPFIANKCREYVENTRKRNTLQVLNHGDFWVNNMLFRYDNGKVCDVRMVDFQICRVAPPTCDFQYFLGASSDIEVRKTRQEELRNAYLTTLNDTLAELGLPQRMSEERFQEDLRKDWIFHFFGITNPLCTILQSSEDVFNLDGVDFNKEGSQMFMNLMKTKGFKEFVPAVLVDLDRRGVFQSFRN